MQRIEILRSELRWAQQEQQQQRMRLPRARVTLDALRAGPNDSPGDDGGEDPEDRRAEQPETD